MPAQPTAVKQSPHRPSRATLMVYGRRVARAGFWLWLMLLLGCARPGAPADLLTAVPAWQWQRDLGDGLASPPVLAGGYVVATTAAAVIALDPHSGAEQWRFAPDGGVWSRSLAASEDIIFVGAPGRVLALNAANGQIRWQQPVVGEMLWPPLVDDGRLFAGTAFVGPGVTPNAAGRAWLYALDAASGQVEWAQETAVYTLITPAANEATLFVGGSQLGQEKVPEGGHIRLHAFDKQTGRLIWTVERQDGFLKSLAVDGSRLFFLAYTDVVFGLAAADGSELWRYPTENWSPGFRLADGRLYLGSDNAFVHAVEVAGGTAVWRTHLEGVFNAPRSTPAADQDALFFQSNDNRLYCLELLTGQMRWQTEPQPRSRVALVVGNGRLFLTGEDENLYSYVLPSRVNQ
ncbi:MAG: PQQ-binding-like beta-propeller repeat protein [Chloroflexi bacterium]|nr:PQQ-binding-like beta-propeller repeat protein [Chloroflexota bacterium]